jgi:hypothetical protein
MPLQFHRAHRAAVVAVAHRADEAADRAHAFVGLPQRGHLLGEVEVLGLDRNACGHARILTPVLDCADA